MGSWSFPLFCKTYLHAERAADSLELGTDLRRATAHLSKQDSVIGNSRAQVRMFVAGGGGKLKEGASASAVRRPRAGWRPLIVALGC